MGKTKREPIGVGEKIQYLSHESNDNTVRVQLSYPFRISKEVLEQAVLTVVQTIDVLHSTFIVEKGKAYWYLNETISSNDCFEVKETENDPMVLADQAMLHTVDPAGKAQLFCTLILGKEQSAIILTISHLCVDGGDAKYLLGKIIEAYNLLRKENSTKQLRLKNGSRSAFQVYDDLDKKDILSAMKGSPNNVNGKSPFPFPDVENGYPHIVKYKLQSHLTQKLKKYGKEKEVTLNDLLLTSFYRAYIDLPNVEIDGPVSIMSMMDLRRHRKSKESEGLCNMSGSLPTVLQDHIYGTFEETLEEIAKQTKKAKEDNIAGLYGLPVVHIFGKILSLDFLTQKMGKAYKSMSIGMTNLGNISEKMVAIDEIYPTDVAFGGPRKKKPGMQIAVSGFKGEITLLSIGEYTDNDASFILELMKNMEKKLEEI